MTRFQELNAILARLPALARSVDLNEAASWTASEHARFKNEIRWCREALGELGAQVESIISQAAQTG